MALKFNPDYLKLAAERPEIKAIKEKSYSLMELLEGTTVLDIGCGPGIDTTNIAGIVGKDGKVYGVDTDKSMVDMANLEANKMGFENFVEHTVCESSNLDFTENYFDACRCERVLQHLSISKAKKTLEEAVRVTKPGGRIVFIDSDWASLSIHSHNARLERNIANVFINSLQNGFAARGMPELFYISAIKEISWEIQVLKLTFSEFERLITPIINRFVYSGYIDLFSWTNMVENLKSLAKTGVFFSTLNVVTCYGRKI